jgi:hypothetical protein
LFGLLDRVGQKLPVPAISLPEEEGEVGGISYRIRGAGPSLLEIAGQILLEVVMARHRMPLAALLAQPHPELLARVDKRRTRPLASDERKLLPLLGEHTAEVLA